MRQRLEYCVYVDLPVLRNKEKYVIISYELVQLAVKYCIVLRIKTKKNKALDSPVCHSFYQADDREMPKVEGMWE